MKKELKQKLENEKAKFNGCYRDEKGKMVKGEVADKNGWRTQDKNGKNKPTSSYWQHRLKCIATNLGMTDEQINSLLKKDTKSDAKAQAKAKREEAKALKEAKRKEKQLERELKKAEAEKAKQAEQEELESLRSKMRKLGVDEEDLPTQSFGTSKGLQCPYNQTRRSGYLCIWLVLAETPDEWVSWDKLETEALAIFEAKWPEYLATKYPDGYDIRKQVGVMDRSPYNKPLESIGQRVIKSPTKGVQLISDTKGESYEDYKARKRGQKVDAQLPPTATAPTEKKKSKETVNA